LAQAILAQAILAQAILRLPWLSFRGVPNGCGAAMAERFFRFAMSKSTMARWCSSAKAMASVVMLCMPTLLSAGRIGVSVERSQATLTTASSGLVGECGYVDNCKECFDKLRSVQCTKKDVCLLMRQLDAFFYVRARNGTLVNYVSPPLRSWLSRGRCARNRRSVRLKPVFSEKLCNSAARREGVSARSWGNIARLTTRWKREEARAKCFGK